MSAAMTQPEPFEKLEAMLFDASPQGPNGSDAASDRVERAWRTWLEALARDAEAALGAAFAYEALDDRGRTAVLDVLEVDAMRLSVPRVAVFAPLLSVETDPARRERICAAMGNDVGANVIVPPRALMGTTKNGDTIVLAETHMYLGFVRVTVCRLTPDRCVHWVRSDPLNDARDVTLPGCLVEGAKLEEVPLRTAVDSIAHALVAQRRLFGELPPNLRPLVELFEAGGCDDGGEVQG